MCVAVRAESIVRAEGPETQVFLGPRRRVTWLRAGGVAVGVVVVLWLVALVAGVLGFGNVSGLRLPGLDRPTRPVLHRTTEPVTASSIRRASSTGTSPRSTPSTARSQVLARRGAGGQAGPGGARRPAGTRPSTSTTNAGSLVSPSVGAIPGNRLGSSGLGTSSTSTSNSNRTNAPGQQDTRPAAPTPSSPNARANRPTTTG